MPMPAAAQESNLLKIPAVKNLLSYITAFVVIASAYILAPSLSFAQQNVSASVNEYFRYGAGDEVQVYGTPAVGKKYLENFTTTQLTMGDFNAGFRYQLYDSAELYGQKFNGIKDAFVEYSKDSLYVRGGRIFGMFGRGLSLNLFENTSIYYDSGLDGLKVAYNKSLVGVNVDATALAGVMTFTDFTDPNDIRMENYDLQAGQIGFSPQLDFLNNSRLGFGWVHATGVLPSPAPQFGVPDDSLNATLPSVNFDATTKDLEWYIEYAGKRTDNAYRPENGTGGNQWSGGMYSSLSYSHPGFGATLEYKDYHYDVVDYNGQANQIFLSTKALPFQNAPTLYKEQTYTLVTRVQHPVDFNDEVGFQLDGFWSPQDNVTVNFNAACASQHYAYRTDSAGNETAIPRADTWLPDFNSAYAPYYEGFLEIEYDFKADSYIKIAFDRTSIPSANALGTTPESSTAFPLFKGEYALSREWGLNWDFENQWINNPETHSDTTAPKFFVPNASTYFSQLISLGFTRSSIGGLTAIYEWSTQTDDISGRRNWFLVEGTIRIGSANTIIISDGEERGGIRCSNGICRYINPFSGWRMTLSSQL